MCGFVHTCIKTSAMMIYFVFVVQVIRINIFCAFQHCPAANCAKPLVHLGRHSSLFLVEIVHSQDQTSEWGMSAIPTTFKISNSTRHSRRIYGNFVVVKSKEDRLPLASYNF